MSNTSSKPRPIRPRGPAADPKYPISTSDENPYNFTPQLLHAYKLGNKFTDKYLFFLNHEGDNPEVCLQQWFPASFIGPKNPYTTPPDDTPVEFPTTEHYMMYHKALLMGDLKIAKEILENAHPSVAKKLGREVANYDGGIWKKHADRVVEEGNLLKFGQNEDMAIALVETADLILVEAK